MTLTWEELPLSLEEGARPIKECYRRVPPGLYDKVWKHLQEMIDVRAIQPSNNPWASVAVLVRKRMASCILVLTQEFRIPWTVYRELFDSPC